MGVLALVTASLGVAPVPTVSAHDRAQAEGGVSYGCGDSLGAVAVVVEPEDARAVGDSRTTECQIRVSVDREVGSVGSVDDDKDAPIGPGGASGPIDCEVLAEPVVTANSISVSVSSAGDCDGLNVRVDIHDQRWEHAAAGRVSRGPPAMLIGVADQAVAPDRLLSSRPAILLGAACCRPCGRYESPARQPGEAPAADHAVATNRLPGNLAHCRRSWRSPYESSPARQPVLARHRLARTVDSGTGEARALVWAEDAVHATLVETESRLRWQFDQSTRVWGGSHGSFYRKHSRFWDDLVDHSGGLVHQTAGTIESYYSWALGEWHSDGFPFSWFPDVDHTQIAYAYGYATGGHSCAMSYTWEGAGSYPNLHVHISCLRTQ